MKNILKYTLAIVFLTTGAGFAQSNINEKETIEVKTIKLDNNKIIAVKTMSEEMKVVNLENSEANQTNQETIDSPIMVSKVIWIDSDKDDRMDRLVHLYYTKKNEAGLDYIVTDSGITFKTPNSSIREFNKVGTYQVQSKDVGNVILSIDNIQSM